MLLIQGVWAQSIGGDVREVFVDNIIVLTGDASANDKEITWDTDGGNIIFGAGTNYIQVKWDTAGDKSITLSFKDSNGTVRTSSPYRVKVYDIPVIDPISTITLGEGETWSVIKARELSSDPNFTDLNSPTIVSDKYYTLDGQKIDDERVFTYEDHGKILRYELNTACGGVFNTGAPVEVNILPSIIELTDILPEYYVNDQLSTTVTIIDNGCDIRGYKWYIDEVLMWDDDTNDTNTSTFVYTVTSADDGKIIKVEVVTDYGSVYTTKQLHTEDILITETHPDLPDVSPTPAGFALREPDYMDLPDNYWENEKYAFFTRDDVNYTDGETVYMSQGGSGWYADKTSGDYEATVKFISTGIFDVGNIPINPVGGTPYNTRDGDVTIFLDTNTTFDVTQPNGMGGNRSGIKWIGCGDVGSVTIMYEGRGQREANLELHSLYLAGSNIVLENIVFDGTRLDNGANCKFINHYIYINDDNYTPTARAGNFIMKDVVFRNITQGGHLTNSKGLISIDDANGYYVEKNASGWDATVQDYFTSADKTTTRYFINVTIDESCELANGTLGYPAGVLLNSSRHVYFENLKVNPKMTTSSVPVWVIRSREVPTTQASTMVPGGLIFNGMENEKDRVSFHLVEGRNIQISSQDYRWSEYKTGNGSASSRTNTALSLYRTLPSPASGLAYYDRKDGYWIIRDGFSRTIKQQLENLRDVYKHANGMITDVNSILEGQNRADLPPLNIKLIVNSSGEIGTLDIPDFGEGIPVNIVPVRDIDEFIYQGNERVVFNPATSSIKLPATNGENVKIYNTDLESVAEYYLADVITETTFANAFPGNFYNCTFKAYKEGDDDLKIKIKSTTPEEPLNSAGFIGNSIVCEDSPGSLKIYFEGTGPWELSYRRDSDGQSFTITVDRNDLVNNAYELTGLTPGQYTLTGVTQNGVSGTVYNRTATVETTPRPVVAPISGPSEVLVGNTIRLTNPTSGGRWMVDNAAIASISQSGELTGNQVGTVEVWYVVQNPDMASCETIVKHTVEVKDNTDSGPDPDPDPEWPPEVPDPDPDPDPNPDAWIAIDNPSDACYTDEFFNIVYHIKYSGKEQLKYAIAFTNSSKEAGFTDIKAYRDLPKDGIISVPIPPGVKPGSYSGYILLRERGSLEYEMYPFTVVIHGGVEIVKQPQQITQLKNGDKIILSVEAKGENLRYQWFYNGQKIPGATSSTYEDIYSPEKEGLYYVEVYGDCDWEKSDEVLVTGCFTTLLNKWHDVLYVEDVKGQYVRFQWYKNGQAIETDGTAIYYPEDGCLNGVYAVRAYLADGTYDITCDAPIFVTIPPLEIYIKWNDVLFVYNWNDKYTRFQWFRNGVQVADDKTPYYNTDGTGGTYFVRAYESDGTYKDSPAIEFNKVVTRASVAVYPTIVEQNHYVTVEGKELKENYAGSLVEIYSLAGNKVYSRRMETSEVTIPMTYGTGVYILQVTAPDGSRKTEKIIIK